MQHRIAVQDLGADGAAMARAVETCVHCGFCLPACPTYRVLGEEMDSPRGRIVLMKQVLEGDLALRDALPHVDRCLGCLGCVTACPSGVRYGELLVPFRAKAEARGRSAVERARHLALLAVLESPRRFRAATRLGQLARRTRRLLPAGVAALLDLVPASLPGRRRLPPLVPARGTRRARVGLLTGCVQQVLDPGINEAAVRLLAACGVEVVVPQGQGCCGALALHTGRVDRASARASHLMACFPPDVDAVLSTAAGCGSAMKEYDRLFEGGPHRQRAAAFAARVRDVTEFLGELGVPDPAALPAALVVAYHDACHLAHGQGVRSAPRTLLARIPNLELREIADGEICCGSAGLYNLEHPDIAEDLGARKTRAILETGAAAVATGNIGCITQLASHLARHGTPMSVLHTVQILERVYGGR